MEGWRTMSAVLPRRRSGSRNRRLWPREFQAQAEELLSGQSDCRPNPAPWRRDHRKKSALAALRGEKELRKAWGGPAAFGGGAGRGPRPEGADRQTYQNSIDESESEIQKRRERLAALSGEGDALQERLTALNGEKLALEAERTAKTRAGQEMNETLLNLERAASDWSRRSPLPPWRKSRFWTGSGSITSSTTLTLKHSGSSWGACPRPAAGSGS